jgi:TonB-linked SusC/RagA family outer membrane protein
MKKDLTIEKSGFHTVQKVLVFMKLTLVCLSIGIMQVSGKVNAQEKVTLKLTNVEIAKGLTTIENQFNYRFLYNNNLKSIKTKINIDVKDEVISQVLDQMFMGTDLSYKMLENNLIVVLSSALTLQDIKVTGKITSDKGEVLSGVSITLKGGKVGTTTDNEGNFILTVPENGTLVISYTGYQTQEVKINSQSVFNLRLVESSKSMDEVVVIGYGSASKRDLTGSIVKIAGKDVADKPNSNPISSLQGQVAGLSVVNNAIPGSTPDVRIRGTISIGSVHPLYVVDGNFNDNISYLNPNDIESIEILKDPSSLAIFGVKGAAGVILVTTKSAHAGQVVVNFNTYYGVKNMVDPIQMANAAQFKSILTQEGQNRYFDNGYTTINNFVANDLPQWTGNSNWINAITQTAHTSSSNISVSASSDKNKFYMGVGYATDEGLVQGVKYDRISISLQDQYSISKNVRVGFVLNGSRENLPWDENGPLNSAMQVAPIIPDGTKSFYARNPYGALTDSAFYNLYSTVPTIQNTLANPFLEMAQNATQINTQDRLVGNAFVEVNFLKNFDFRATGYIDLTQQNQNVYTPLLNQYNPDPFPGDPTVIPYGSGLTSVTQTVTEIRKYQTDFILNYKKQFGSSNLTLTGGFTTTYNGVFPLEGQINQAAGADPIPNDQRFWYLSTGFGNAAATSANSVGAQASPQYENTTVSGLFRALYNYQNKYYLNASFRRDITSQFLASDPNQGQNFWAVGAAWEVTREKFMENQKFFNYLKIKGSTGLLGNSNANVNGTYYPYPAYPGISANSSAVFGSHIVNAYVSNYQADPNLEWETVNSSELGVEFVALQNRLHFEFDYYKKLTHDLLIQLQLAGQQPQLTNDGNISNDGVEFSAGWTQAINKDWSFSVNGNLTTYQNKVISIGTPLLADPQVPSQTTAGQPIGYFYGYKVIGVYQSYADILASPPSSVNGQPVAPGDLKYADLNHDGVINSADQTNIGNPTPKFGYGGSININYQHLELGVEVNGVYGNQIYREWGTSLQENSLYNYPSYDVNAWHGAGTSNWIPIVDAQHLNNRAPSSYGIEDGSYFRIRNLQLGYNFASNLLSRAHLKNVKIFVNVQNLKTWKNNLGYSPEYGGFVNSAQAGAGASATSFGVDVGDASAAIPRIITGGINVTF